MIVLWMEDEFTHQKVAKLCDLGIARVYDGLGQGFTRGIGTEEFLAPVPYMSYISFTR